MQVGDLAIDSRPWVHIDVTELTARGRHAPRLHLSLTLRSPEHRRVELRDVVVALVVGEEVIGEGRMIAETVHPEGGTYNVVMPTTRSLLAYATDRLGQASSLDVQLRWRGLLRLFVEADAPAPQAPGEPARGAWTEGSLTDPAPLHLVTITRGDWFERILRPTEAHTPEAGRRALGRVAIPPARWVAGIAAAATAGLLLQLFTGVFGQWLSLASAEDALRPGPDIFVSTDIVYLDDEGRSMAMPGDFQPGPDLENLMAQSGAAVSPEFLGALRANGGVNVGKLSIRIVAQGQRSQQVRILDIRPVSLQRTTPLAGTLFNIPPQGGDPTMKMIFDMDEPDPIARKVEIEVGPDGDGLKGGGAFFGDTTISLQDGEQQVLVVRASTTRYDVTFNLKIDYLVGTTRKTMVITDHGQPFHVTAQHCGSTPGTLSYQRAFQLQGDFSLRPDVDPHRIEYEISCGGRLSGHNG